ncbi:hypothetical protein TWF569_001283 [Orbilia oligospora]|uniref:Small ribosomal subunit protein mS38 n=1 Tax=Orbilia oligospora TaxID=2813651 RepID=A0A7C8JKJ2_ORBOL|nr:hypothetical protein TWF706_007745 [Orbilia oligospora]KAF3105319.1 hypothetical protein TWF102_002249 [Orbilia oligospora]KAF3112480.1 hypothetical protein TWF103_003243 [Orbilia oligospora]KAF3124365.1 hypothetical protein TWF569_001283 [Orbilia oligospora]KAF3124718.1 hypothetical protein TWF703_011224 [Orbilia oligospora]
MFACPTRRALLSCSSYAPPTSRRLISTATATSIQQRPSRRYSSSSSSSSNSKPFGPNNRGLASKTGAFRKRERQCENGQQQQQQTAQTIAPPMPAKVEIKSEQTSEEPRKIEQSPLPFVARTDHLRAKDIHASAFFALHRPVSVRFPVPGIYNSNSFQKLFDPSTPLSNMELHKIQQEVQARQPTINENDSTSDQDSILSPDEVRAYARNGAQTEQKSSSSEPQIKISSSLLFEQYLPFNPPPPPEPISGETIKTEKASFEKLKGMQIITSTEGSADGQPYILAFFQGPENQTNRVGRIRKTMRSEVPTMQALSVKRQRKLKMKKHKYKKLMKRTRTLRRRLEKQ